MELSRYNGHHQLSHDSCRMFKGFLPQICWNAGWLFHFWEGNYLMAFPTIGRQSWPRCPVWGNAGTTSLSCWCSRWGQVWSAINWYKNGAFQHLACNSSKAIIPCKGASCNYAMDLGDISQQQSWGSSTDVAQWIWTRAPFSSQSRDRGKKRIQPINSPTSDSERRGNQAWRTGWEAGVTVPTPPLIESHIFLHSQRVFK